ncbi:hypothetical protein DSECCO2_661550 [anaerobic digester metagenome]
MVCMLLHTAALNVQDLKNINISNQIFRFTNKIGSQMFKSPIIPGKSFGSGTNIPCFLGALHSPEFIRRQADELMVRL